MKTFKSYLKAARFVYENFEEKDVYNILYFLYKDKIVKCSYNRGSEVEIILCIDKYGILD